jgi:glycosyltransferase involved in cell wall biosynthesis
MRILHVHSGNLFGGVESILLSLVRKSALCPEMEMHFALCFEGRLSGDLAASGAPVHRLGVVRVRRPWTVWRARRGLRRLLARDRFDAAICHSSWSQAIFGPVLRAAAMPTLYWLHNRTTGRGWFDRWARRAPPDRIVAVSRSTAETAPFLFPDVTSEICYPPLAVEESKFVGGDRDAVRAALETPLDAAVIIQVSRMEAWKGHRLHLQALARLKDVPGWICWQVGGPERPEEGRYFEDLRRSAAELGIEKRVRFLGRRADVPRLLMAADLFCQPNLDTEGFGVVFMEAFYAGLPIVTTAIGAALEVIDESCGILLPVGDLDSLTESLQTLLCDPDLRARLGKAGRQRVLALCDPARQMYRLSEMLQIMQRDHRVTLPHPLDSSRK